MNNNQERAISVIWMLLLGFLVGVIAGYGAVVFRIMISFFHNLLFFAEFNLLYNANVHTLPSLWGVWIIFVPVVGAIGVTWIIKTFAPEAKGHGVPEVIDAIYYNKGKIRPAVAFFKSLASALSIGSGGSVGREGPIIQIGAAFGSTLGQIFKLPLRQCVILIAAGAGGGIAATFNSPIGGVAFAIELLLVSVNALTLAVVAIATVTATYIGRYYLGLYPAFDIPSLAVPATELTSVLQLIVFIPFGILIGLGATLFIKAIYGFEDFFEKLPINDYFRHMLGMFIVGIMMYLFMRYAGHYYIQGVGYATIVDILQAMLRDPWFLLLLCGAKLLATSLTLGSGASGGIFSPGLFMGATFGAAVGNFILMLFPDLPIHPIMFAVAGMAGMISGTTGAVLTGITMLFEMTRDYNAILPIVLTATIAYVIRRALSKESIYTLKLLRRGHIVQEGLQAALSSARTAEHVMRQDYLLVEEKDLKLKTTKIHEHRANNKPVIITVNGQIKGVLTEEYVDNTIDLAVDDKIIFVKPDTSLLEVLRQLGRCRSHVAFVMSTPDKHSSVALRGLITSDEVTDFATKSAEFMG